MPNPLMRHQMHAVARAHTVLVNEDQHGFYLDHGVGTGKSLTAITIARLLGARKVLVLVGPVIAKNVWQSELQKWWPNAGYAINGGPVHYSILHSNHDEIIEIVNIDALKPDLMRRILRNPPDLLIFDEAHYGANGQAARTRKFWKLANASKKVLLMSGTPAHNLLGYWSQYRAINPAIFEKRFGDYKRRVAQLGGPDGNWVLGFYIEAAQQVATAIAPYTDIFKTEDLHLPEPLYTEIPTQLTAAERKAYDQMNKDFEATVPEGTAVASTALVKAMRLHQIACGHATLDLLAARNEVDFGYSGNAWAQTEPSQEFIRWFKPSSKMDALMSLLEDRKHQKIVIACRYLTEVEEICRRVVSARAVGSWLSVIEGKTPAAARAVVVDNFQNDPKPHLMVIQNRSGGISADMTAADALILYSLDPSTITYRQVVGRVWRLGQTGHVQIITFLAENTVEGKLYEGLKQGLDDVDLAKYIGG